MKKIIAGLFVSILLLYSSPAWAVGYWTKNTSQGFFNLYGVSTLSTFALDSAFNDYTSGDAYLVLFNSPVSQTSGTLEINVYCSAGVTGSPTSSSIDLYSSAVTSGVDDPQRPVGAPVASSGNVDASGCSSAKWLTYTISSVTLVVGKNYWLALHNDTATQSSNFFTINTRSIQFGAFRAANNYQSQFNSFTTTDGFSTDPTGSGTNNGSHVVLVFNDGTKIGNGFTVSTASANDTNYRGNRYTFNEDVMVSGVVFSTTFTGTTTVTLEVYNGSTQLSTTTLDLSAKINGSGVFFSAPIKFPKRTAIDIVFKLGASGTAGTYVGLGTSPPANVTATAGPVTYVTGATPGSFTETANQFITFMLMIDELPINATTIVDSTIINSTIN